MTPLDAALLPSGIRSRFVDDINGLSVHILEAGFGTPGRPLIVMLHGFPEIAYSWRKVMPALAEVGYHVVAPDLRGYGRTTGWSANYDDDLRPFRPLNAVRDTLGLVSALGYRTAACADSAASRKLPKSVLLSVENCSRTTECPKQTNKSMAT